MKMNVHELGFAGNRQQKACGQGRTSGFTLVELLTVISIIALMAGIAVSVGGLAKTKSRQARMNSEHQKLVTAIDAYKAEMGFYPPDHADLAILSSITATNRTRLAGMNPLFYELSGAIFDNIKFVVANKEDTEAITPADLLAAFGAKGISNSARQKRDIPYKGLSFKPSEYREVDGYASSVQILMAPVDGPNNALFKRKGGTPGGISAWLYDCSSPYRHNPDTYDLWCEYTLGNKTVTVGNWKE